MGRFLKSPEQQFVQMGVQKDMNFYQNLLSSAEQNLNQSTAIKAAAIDRLYDIPFSSKEDSDAVVGRAQEILKNVTESAFPTPSTVTNAVMQANAEIMPGVQAAKAKAQAADMYDKMRIQYGPNAWMGTDPRSIAIMQSQGKYTDPSVYKATGIDASEIDKAFLASQLSELTKSFDRKAKSDLPGYHKIEKVTGMDDDKRLAKYGTDSPEAIAMAQSLYRTMPQLKELGNEEDVVKRIVERNYQTTGAYKQSVDSQYMRDLDFIDAETRARLEKDSLPVNPWLSLGDTNKSSGEIKPIDEGMFDKNGRIKEYEISGDFPTKGVKSGTLPFMNVAGYKDNSNLKTKLQQFKTNNNLPGTLSDRETFGVMMDMENKLSQSFGSVWAIPESKDFSMRPMTQNIFVNDKGEFGDFTNRRVWIDGEELKDADKVKALGNKLGVSDEKLKEKLSSIGTANITFTGSSSSAIVGTVADKKGREVKIEVSNYDQIASAGKDIYNITSHLRERNNNKFKLEFPAILADENGKPIKADMARTVVKLQAYQDASGKTQYEAVPVVELYNSEMGGEEPLTTIDDFTAFGDNARNRITPYITLKN